ncbi:MAG: ABC transporter ATP-binding protein [Oscillospiraceae bacterium]|nr:ABC transporter ATP-binding protein [Oscillospiraceae bacterium]
MIELKNLTKRFDKLVAVNNVNATIKDGTICGLAGSNGSGKSTMLRMLSGVYQPDDGVILIDGENAFENMNVKSRCYYISDYPFFSNNATLKKLSLILKKIYPNWDQEYYNKLCEYFPIDPKGKIINMSKGMQRQAALILAFATKPKYLFLDEIFDGLDPVIRQTLKKLIIENVTDNNMTAVIASHNLREFDDICDTMILIHNGDIVANTKVEEMKTKSFKIQIAFSQDVTAEIFADMDTKNIMQKGRYFTLIASGDEQEINRKLMEKNPAFVEMLPLTLEEVFINEMGGAGYEVY